MAAEINKIALGTVQFGLNYGISNISGQVKPDQVKEMLAVCRRHQVYMLDTAAAYGKSEEVLGLCLPACAGNFKLISKLPTLNGQNVRDIFFKSLEKLGVQNLYGYLIHDYASFTQRPEIYQEVLNLQAEGYIQKVGFSVYHPAQLENLFLKNVPLQLIQIPFNVFDQRFAPLLGELIKREIEIHVRSVFLQGLFFKKTAELPIFFNPVKSQLEKLQQIAQVAAIPLPALLLAFAHSFAEISKIVIGVTSVAELETNLQYRDYLPKVQMLLPSFKELMVDDENMILPYNWKLND